MPRLSYHRYCTSSHDNYTATRTEFISMLQLHRATNEESRSSPGNICKVNLASFVIPNMRSLRMNSMEFLGNVRRFNFNPNAAILHQHYVKFSPVIRREFFKCTPKSREESHWENPASRRGLDPTTEGLKGNRRTSGLFETHSQAQSRDYTDIVTITLTVTLSP